MARPVFEPVATGPFGGSEVRAYLFATGLARQGIPVDVVVQTHDLLNRKQVDHVELWYQRLPAPLVRGRDEPSLARRIRQWPSASARRLGRSLQKRWAQLGSNQPRSDRLLANVDADVYCCFGVHEHAASVVHTASCLGRASVLMLASDTDLSASYTAASGRLNDYRQRADLCHYAISKATRIVAQTDQQHRQLQQRFGRESIVIRNPIELDGSRESRNSHGAPASNSCRQTATDVLWIGRADCFSKRADLAIQLARACPTLQFTLIMNPRDDRIYRQLVDDVPPNARIVPHVPWREIDEYFSSSRLLLNTSTAEGFPNTFLQAAKYRVPIVSLNADPDRMLSRHGCGIVTHGDLPQTIAVLHEWCSDDTLRRRLGTAGQEYVFQYHDADARCRELAALLRDACGSGANADMKSADLVRADLTNTDLTNTDLKGAVA